MCPKKELTDEEKEIIQKEQNKHVELFQNKIAPLYSILFNYIKQICILCTVINGTAIITIFTSDNPILLCGIDYFFANIICIFVYIFLLCLFHCAMLGFLSYNKKVKFYTSTYYNILLYLVILTCIFVTIELFFLAYGLQDIIANLRQHNLL